MLRRAPLLGFLSRHPAAMQWMLEQLSMAAVQAAYSFSGRAPRCWGAGAGAGTIRCRGPR